MEVWLKNSESDQILLPVTPSEFHINEKSGNTTVTINDLGEINLLGKRGLKEVSISSFFPNQEYPFIQYGWHIKKTAHSKVIQRPEARKYWSSSRKKYILVWNSISSGVVIWYTEKTERVSLKDPYEYVNKILKWKKNGTVVRLLIGEKINLLVSIESFEYGEQDGTGDVYYTIVFKEYREIMLLKSPIKSVKASTKKKKRKKKKKKKSKKRR